MTHMRGNQTLIVISIMLATIMQALDTTIANVALPHMQGSLSATQDQVSWVLTSYIVAAAIMTPLSGFLATRFGRKKLLLLSIGGFTITSILCGMAMSLPQIVLFRLMQGIFGASLVPLSQAVLLDTFPKEKHGRAMALWGVGVMLGIGIGALQLMLDRGQGEDWFSSTEIIIEATVAGLCLYMFIVHMMTARHPFLEPALFKDQNYVACLFFMFMVGVLILATMALLPPYLQNLMGYPIVTTGMVLAPRGVGTMVAMMIVGRMIGKVDTRILILFGQTLVAYSLWEMSLFNLNIAQGDLVRTGLIQGFGIGFVFVPLSTIAYATLEPRLRNEATALFSLIRNIGSSIGVSIVIALLVRNTQIHHADLAAHLTPYSPALQSAKALLTGENVISPYSTAGLQMLNGEVTRQAAAIAYLNDFRLIMYMTLASLGLLFMIKVPKRARPNAPAEALAME